MRSRPHEKLEIYRLAHALAVRAHRLSLRLPRYELYGQASQIRRASKSVSAQIVEGHALRSYKADYVRYLSRAYGSAEETIEHLRFVLETGSADGAVDDCAQLIEEYVVLTRKLFNYMRGVRQQHDPERVGDATLDERQ